MSPSVTTIRLFFNYRTVAELELKSELCIYRAKKAPKSISVFKQKQTNLKLQKITVITRMFNRKADNRKSKNTQTFSI